MKVLFIYDFCNFGGVSSVLKQRDLELISRGIDPIYLFDRDNGGYSAFNSHVGGRAHLDYRSLASLVRDFDNNDAVVVFDDPDLITLVSELFSGRIFIEVHSSLDRSLDRLSQYNLARVEKVVVPSAWSLRAVRARTGNLGPDIVVVHNFPGPEFRVTSSPKVSRGCREFVWIGKIITDKNYADAVRIFGLLKPQIGQAKFTFVTGGVPNIGDVRRFLNAISISEIASETLWLANLNPREIAQLLISASETGGALLSTSKFESFGLAVLEAMSVGLPCIYYDAGALHELATPCFEGRVELGDIQGAVEKLVAHCEGWQSYEQTAACLVRHAAKFGPHEAMEQYVNLVLARA